MDDTANSCLLDTCRQPAPEPGTAMAYVDGMNLYYGAVKDRPCLKWLNIQSLLESLVPAYRIVTIRYYAAQIKRAYPGDESHSRPRKYLDALSSLSKIDIRYGTYSRFPSWRRIYEDKGLSSPELFRPNLNHPVAVGRLLERAQSQQPPEQPFVLVRVWKDEEKGSDVNLATDLIVDALVDRRCRTVVIVTNDSDLAYPISMVAQARINVILVNPFIGRPAIARGLSQLQVKRLSLKTKLLQAHQLPNPVITPEGKLYRPSTWNKKPSA